MSLTHASVREIRDRVTRGEVQAVEVIDDHLAAIAAIDPTLQAFTAVAADRAREAAATLDARLADILAGRPAGTGADTAATLPLAGVPFAVKDNFDVTGEVTRAGSQVRVQTDSGDSQTGTSAAVTAAEHDASVVAALRRAGAIPVGRTNMDELAYGMRSWPTRNPRQHGHAPGGSSGGSAAAVAGFEAPFALGSDTGGSVQVPAGLCGIVGFKPGHGVLSTAGLAPLSPTLDHVGVLCRSVDDAELIFAVLVPGFQAAAPPTTISIGVPDRLPEGRIAAGVDQAFHRALNRLRDAEIATAPFALPSPEQFLAVETHICVPEFAEAHSARVQAQPDAYRKITHQWVTAGLKFPRNAYEAALTHQARLREAWQDALQSQVVLTPMAPVSAPPYGVTDHVWPDGTVEDYDHLLGHYANMANVTGFPAISLPAGEDGQGLPVGVQLIGTPGGEAELLAIARVIAPILAGN